MPPKITARRVSRELALQILYQCELTQHTVPEVLEHFPIWEETKDSVKTFALQLTEGVLSHRAELDQRLAATAEKWSVDRMAPVDRNILRLGAYELLFCPDTPSRVVINEAIELAKKFSTSQSGRFVNGLLDALSKQNDTADKDDKADKDDRNDKEKIKNE